MKRVLVASVAPMLLLAQFSDGFAAGGSGPFNGNWTGSATSTVEQCKSAKVTVTVEGMIVTGQAQFANDAPNINGTVREDGTFGATIGWQPLTGKFSADEFEGMFKNGDCEWKMLLQTTWSRDRQRWIDRILAAIVDRSFDNCRRRGLRTVDLGDS
jgi:hypothetical protein